MNIIKSIAVISIGMLPLIGLAQTLKSQSDISTDMVSLYDIFDGITIPNRPVLQAPPLGKSYSLTADYLQKIAKQHGVNWVPVTNYEMVKITRRAELIAADELTNLIHQELLKQELVPANAKITIKLFGNNEQGIFVENGTKSLIKIDNIAYNKQTRSASILIGSYKPTTEPVKVNARVDILREAFVPAIRINGGEIITEDMITKIYLPENEFQSAQVRDMADAVGKEAKRSLAANRPINNIDLKIPNVIKPKELITIMVKTQQMQLSAKGRAIDGGAKGDIIRVENLQSGKIVQATIIGTGIAIVEL